MTKNEERVQTGTCLSQKQGWGGGKGVAAKGGEILSCKKKRKKWGGGETISNLPFAIGGDKGKSKNGGDYYLACQHTDRGGKNGDCFDNGGLLPPSFFWGDR